MFAHRKKPLFPVKVSEVNPKFAQKLLEQFGGRSGEFTAMTEYFVQSFACDRPAIRDMLLDIATEEIGHLEMVGLMIEQLLRGTEREKAYEDTLFSMMGKGPQLVDSLGNAWTSDWVRSSGDIVADLKHNISAEAGAKVAYDRLIQQTDDYGCKETLTYLMTREISHQRMFMLALESLDYKSEGTLKPSDDLNTYYNLSRDGEGEKGIGVDSRGPWNADGAWNFVDRPEETLSATVDGPLKQGAPIP
jgi:Mn-containing catalase